MRKRKGFTLIELLVVIAIIALLISILLPSLSRARELSKRLVCASNMSGLGKAVHIYSNDNYESFPVVAYNPDPDVSTDYTTFSTWGKQYTTALNSPNQTGTAPGVLVWSQTDTTTVSTTRCLWMLVRGGQVTPKSFVCPSSGDQVAQNPNIDLYYDFNGLTNISYGYQVPFGPFDTRASESSDPRLPVAADKGPYSTSAAGPAFTTELPNSAADWNPSKASGNLSPQQWQQFNSGNHGGRGTGEGQNVLYQDGHATFERTPLSGIDDDNIYTAMNANAGLDSLYEWRICGLAPRVGSHSLYPGEGGLLGDADATTDALIYP